MKNLSYKYLALLWVLVLASCSDDLLEKQPIGRFDSADYLTTDAEAESAIYGLYDFLATGYNNYGDWSSLFFAKVLPGDDINPGGGSAADQPKLQSLSNFTFESDNAALNDVWLSLYRIVSSSNSIISTVSEDVSTRDKVIAEAKFFRAYAYFELVTMWGAVPYYTENPINKEEQSVPRVPTATIYAGIEQDLMDAIKDLPVKSDYPANLAFRVSKGTAQALLGKIYLYQQKYALSHQIFETLISSHQYALNSDYSKIWLRGERGGSESIFEVLYTSTNGHDWSGPWDGTAKSNFVIQLMGPRGDGSFNKLDTIGYSNGWGFNVPTKKFGDMLNAEAGSIRAKTSVISEADFLKAGGTVDKVKGNNNWSAYEGYIRLKYCTRPSETTQNPDQVKEVNYNTPFKLIRYADVLLMAAEAYNKDGKDAEAIALIKLVRERAGFTDHTSWDGFTGTALFDFIVKERSLELAFEGHRYWDLVRWGLADKEVKGFIKGKHEHYPIPRSEIDLNTAISPADQNPGY